MSIVIDAPIAAAWFLPALQMSLPLAKADRRLAIAAGREGLAVVGLLAIG